MPLLDRLAELRHTDFVKFVPGVVPAAPAVAPAAGDGHTRRAIIQLLLESGPITAGGISAQLGLSAAGVRRHLDALIEAGDAQANAAAAWQQEGRGRPAKRYLLTAAGRAKLEHAYDDLASAAMRQLREIGGDVLGMPAGPVLADALGAAEGSPLLALEMLYGLSDENLIDVTGGTAEIVDSRVPRGFGIYVIFLLWEIITGKQVSEKIMERATSIGLIILLSFMVYANGLDIFRLFK
mgnify:CR=1 FL=1